MAIPFAFPSDDDTDENYQRLDQLLSDLFVVLQQILVTQRRIRDAQPSQIAHRVRYGQSSSNIRRNGDGSDPPSSFPPPEPPRHYSGSEIRVPADFLSALQPASSSTVVDSAALASTDLLHFESTIDQGRSPSRRRRRRRRTSSESSCCEEAKNNTVLDVVTTTQDTPHDWTQVGDNLRQIANDFYASVGKEEPQQSEDSKIPCGVEANPADASLLSMLVPPPFGGSIWTAVIFVVGWRLLARVR